jgi:hypothetical protein
MGVDKKRSGARLADQASGAETVRYDGASVIRPGIESLT